MIKQQQSEGHGSIVSTRRKAPSYSFLSCFCPPASPKGRILDTLPFLYELGFFSSVNVWSQSLLFFSKETAECQDENSKEEAQATKSEGKEKKYNKKQEEPEKDPDPAKDRPRKSRYLCIALKITQLFPGIYQFCFCFLILGVN